MSKSSNQSFTKIEHEVIHHFREQINLAESMADVRLVFSRTIQGIILKVFDNKVDIKVEDITFMPDQEPGYTLSEKILRNETFKQVWSDSDLPQIVERFAFSAGHRFKQLKKHHDDGTGSKIGRH